MRPKFLSTLSPCLLIAAGFIPLTGVAADLLGAYVGASAGQSTVKADPLEFSEHDLGWKVSLGIRPIAVLGAEIVYLDFGHPSYSQGVPGGSNISARASATEALGLVYLPLPISLVDLYAKGGIARLNYRASSSSGCLACTFFNADYTQTRFAYGAGAQLKFDKLAVRIEYDRVSATNGDPSLISAGLTWTFW